MLKITIVFAVMEKLAFVIVAVTLLCMVSLKIIIYNNYNNLLIISDK